MELPAWMEDVRRRVNTRLETVLTEAETRTRAVSRNSVELPAAVREFALRGGKRLRPAIVDAAFHAIAPAGAPDACAELGVALELLHTSLLIHDDWMDDDATRRGGPTVHVVFRDRYGDAHLGASLAVLAGSLAGSYAWEVFAGIDFPASHAKAARAEFLHTQQRVFLGQELDLTANTDVWLMQDLKTASYTARAPARLGAMLAGADDAAMVTLDRFAAAIGVAFQLRDDLLGVLGDEKTTGKPRGNDLRTGKRTAILRELERLVSVEDRRPVTSVLGRKFATEEELAPAVELIVTSGAKDAVEHRIGELAEEARAALEGTNLHVERLREVVELMAFRDK